MRPMRAFLLLPVFLLAACGQSGDLYLPPPKAPPAESAAPATVEPAPKLDEKDKQ